MVFVTSCFIQTSSFSEVCRSRSKMFYLLIIFGALLFVYLLIYFTAVKMPRFKGTAKLHGKTVIVTGSNTGIGKVTALELAKRGARVILACRDKQRAEAALSDIKKESGNNEVAYMNLDLGSLQSVRSFAENFLNTEPRLDILINNAGVVRRGKTKDGLGLIFGVNHIGHFLLTNLLLERLKECGPSRVVTVASKAHEWGTINFDCINKHKDVCRASSDRDLIMAYAHSKLCNVLFTHELAKRLEGTSVTCYSLHPGGIRTDIARHASFFWKMVMVPLYALFSVDIESGVQTTLHCALQEGIEPLSGRYFSKCAVQEVYKKARNDATAKKLWEVSESLCGLA